MFELQNRYPTYMVVMDVRTQQVLVDQLFSVPKCVRLARMSERPCCKRRLLEQKSWSTARNSVDKLEKVLEDSEVDEQGQEALE